MKITRNVAGIKGFHLMTDAFDENTESRLFNKYYIETTGKDKISFSLSPYEISSDKDILSICDVIRESGFLPEHHIPNYILALSYPPNSSFRAHKDSVYRWGEFIVGINLGHGIIRMYPEKGTPQPKNINTCSGANTLDILHVELCETPATWSTKIALPQRSVYVMSDEARYLYKHEMVHNSEKNMSRVPFPLISTIPKIRVSLTMRSTKGFSDMMLKLEDHINTSERLSERLAHQKKYPETSFLKSHYGCGIKKAREKEGILQEEVKDIIMLYHSYQLIDGLKDVSSKRLSNLLKILSTQ